jgi:hypothetical protein
MKMDKKRVAVILGMVSKIYGRQVDTADADVTIALWSRYLCDEPDDLVQLAFDQWIAGEKWAPKPAEILELIEKAKGEIFSRYVVGEIQRPPDEYCPRYVARKPKQYELAIQNRVMKMLDGIGKLLEGEKDEKERQ